MSNSPLGYTNLGEWDISPPQGRTPFDMNQHAVRARSVRLLATIKSGNICWRAFRIRLRFDWARHLFDGKLRRPSGLRTRSPRTSVRVLAHWCASTGRGEGAPAELGLLQVKRATGTTEHLCGVSRSDLLWEFGRLYTQVCPEHRVAARSPRTAPGGQGPPSGGAELVFVEWIECN